MHQDHEMLARKQAKAAAAKTIAEEANAQQQRKRENEAKDTAKRNKTISKSAAM